ncbi:TetR/AcrR family transcriptional regulator [Clostridium intestinale]|uniref:Transcriptional regulator, TetR family n=1 Tax=Clostridium intestinale DSM 6191 TaxID=1121320 RepID=A0A1M5VZZ1_9CLOT|nr:TetR/AcrR family transcriptional regulator [Clostridium intestinale]SHH80750.1 transcriptional regulator, TetR family [Clostridium intestinale DSM 6191]
MDKNDIDKKTLTRRRGDELVDAILKACWDELSEMGYTSLTIEGVAARAKTNKAVIYRRWENKSRLVIETLKKYIPRSEKVTPNTGNLREDVFLLLKRIAVPLQMIGGETIHGLMVEYFSKHIINSFPQIMSGIEGRFENYMRDILKNAELRGEVDLEKITSRIISLPLDLVRYEILTTHKPITENVLNEIVDDIFMPLIK